MLSPKYTVNVRLRHGVIGFAILDGVEYRITRAPDHPALMSRSEAMTAIMQILSRRDGSGWEDSGDTGIAPLQFSVVLFTGEKPCPGCRRGKITGASRYMALCDQCGDLVKHMGMCPSCREPVPYSGAMWLLRAAGVCGSCRGDGR